MSTYLAMYMELSMYIARYMDNSRNIHPVSTLGRGRWHRLICSCACCRPGLEPDPRIFCSGSRRQQSRAPRRLKPAHWRDSRGAVTRSHRLPLARAAALGPFPWPPIGTPETWRLGAPPQAADVETRRQRAQEALRRQAHVSAHHRHHPRLRDTNGRPTVLMPRSHH